MTILIIIIFINTILLLLQSYVIYRLTESRDSAFQLIPNKPSLKPWTKKEKRKPKANDDSAAWRKENNIE